MIPIGQRIKELRADGNITQKQLAEKLQIAPNTLSQYENGVLEPNLEIVAALTKIFNVSADYLLGLKEY